MARRPAEWMTPLDERILELLAAEGWATPRSIARRVSLGASVGRVRERCRLLSQTGLVAPLSRALLHYEITGAGRRYLAGELDASEQPGPSVNR
ncbi:winged helix-turn-helix domain-containing protein [Haloarcula salinisoli]|uniref:Winged helix-turn-helix domain-containing protein n=1 Tax=Haloarcula salinisoli TaxID=2487746 RepID=A0A8J8CAL3_9EURY|nr:winged helix-turn-helix domain-containing protein [Halomicroarcula salinisoli]MBX0288205.1 winged helix-turn-helix domain-containing protein [Halomicroarcula salinisoli]MBX0305369.1 winged helix-turn-helix domain-containing protein [Halomicroarcula salinisoli]